MLATALIWRFTRCCRTGTFVTTTVNGGVRQTSDRHFIYASVMLTFNNHVPASSSFRALKGRHKPDTPYSSAADCPSKRLPQDHQRKFMTRHTKIVATLGPSSRDPLVLETLIRTGVDVFLSLIHI